MTPNASPSLPKKSILKCARFIFCSLALVLGACATNPYDAEPKARSDKLLEAQLDRAQKALEASTTPRVVYAGFATNSLSKAFRGDVELVEARLKEIDPDAVVIKLSNPPVSHDEDLPFATFENIRTVIKKLPTMLRKEDKLVLLFTTHGATDKLSIHAGQKHYPNLSLNNMRDIMRSLGERPVMLLLSACYSGSFIPLLARESRAILTAAAADRSSFGCHFQHKQTYFIEGLFQTSWNTSKSMKALFEDAKIDIEKKEKYSNLQPSLPQISLGAQTEKWMDTPLKDWLRP